MTALLSLLVACDGSGDHHPTDDTGDSEAALDLAPSLSADVSLGEGALGGELLVTLTVDDEDPEGVTLEAVLADDLVSGDLDGSVWVGTAGSEVGTSSLTFTATDAGGQTATLELPVVVYAARTWTGLMVLQGPTDEVLGLDMGVSSEGWTFAGGYAGTSAIASGLEPDGTMTWTAYYAADSEIGRGVAYDEATGTTALSSQKRVSGSNQGAPLVGLDDSGGEAWRASDAYYVSSGYTAGYYVAARDGVVVQAGPFLDTGAGVSGAWGRLIDAADGSDLGAPIAFSAHATASRRSAGSSTCSKTRSPSASRWRRRRRRELRRFLPRRVTKSPVPRRPVRSMVQVPSVGSAAWATSCTASSGESWSRSGSWTTSMSCQDRSSCHAAQVAPTGSTPARMVGAS